MLGGIQVLEVKCKGTDAVCLCDGGKKGSIFILLNKKTEATTQKATGAGVHSYVLLKGLLRWAPPEITASRCSLGVI